MGNSNSCFRGIDSLDTTDSSSHVFDRRDKQLPIDEMRAPTPEPDIPELSTERRVQTLNQSADFRPRPPDRQLTPMRRAASPPTKDSPLVAFLKAIGGWFSKRGLNSTFVFVSLAYGIMLGTVATQANWGGKQAIHMGLEKLFYIHATTAQNSFNPIFRETQMVTEATLSAVNLLRGDTQLDLTLSSTLNDPTLTKSSTVWSLTELQVATNASDYLGSYADSLYAKGSSTGDWSCVYQYSVGLDGSRDTKEAEDCSFDPKLTTWYEKGQQLLDPEVSWIPVHRSELGAFADGTSDWLMAAVGTVLDQEGEFSGVVMGGMSLSDLERRANANLAPLLAAQEEDDLEVHLVDSDGFILFSTEDSLIGSYIDDDATSTAMKRSVEWINEEFGSISGVDVTNITVYMGQDQDEKDVAVAIAGLGENLQVAGLDARLIITADKLTYITYFNAGASSSFLIWFLSFLVTAFVFVLHKQGMDKYERALERKMQFVKMPDDDKLDFSFNNSLGGDHLKQLKPNWFKSVWLIICVLSAGSAFFWWQKQISDDVEHIGVQASKIVANSTHRSLEKSWSLREKLVEDMLVEVQRKGYLVSFQPDMPNNTCVAGPNPPYSKAPDSLLHYIYDISTAFTESGEADLTYLGVMFDNGILVFSLFIKDEDALSLFVSDNLTYSYRAPYLSVYDNIGVRNESGQSSEIPDTIQDLLDSPELWSSEYTSSLMWQQRVESSFEDLLGIDPFISLVGHSYFEWELGNDAGGGLFFLGSSLTSVMDASRQKWTTQEAKTKYALEDLTQFMCQVQTDSTNRYYLFEELAFASVGDVLDAGSNYIFANESDDSRIQEIADEVNRRINTDALEDKPAVLQVWPEGVNTSSFETLIVRYGSNATWATLSTLEIAPAYDWLLLTAVRRTIYMGPKEQWDAVTLLVAMGTLATLVYFFMVYGKFIQKKLHNMTGVAQLPRQDSASLMVANSYMESKIDSEADWKHFIKQHWSTIWKAGAKLHDLERKETVFDRCRRYLIDSYSNKDRLTLQTIYLEAEGSLLSSFFPKVLRRLFSRIWWYNLSTNQAFVAVTYLMILCHIILSFFEAPYNPSSDYFKAYGSKMLTTNGICTFWHVFDLLLTLGIHNGCHKMSESVRNATSRVSKSLIFRTVIVLFMLYDWVYLASTDYVVDHTLTEIKSNDLYQNTLLPWTSPLRGVLLILRHEYILVSMSCFIRTVLGARDVIVVGVSFLTVGVCLAITLLPGIYNEEEVGRNADDYRSTFIMMYALIFTGENYPDVVYPSFEYSEFYRAYFIFFAFIGVYILFAIIIASFQKAYSKYMDDYQEKEHKENRMALVIAFVLLRQFQETRGKECTKFLSRSIEGDVTDKNEGLQDKDWISDQREPACSPDKLDNFVLINDLHKAFIKDVGGLGRHYRHLDSTIGLYDFVAHFEWLTYEDLIRFDVLSQEFREQRKEWLQEEEGQSSWDLTSTAAPVPPTRAHPMLTKLSRRFENSSMPKLFSSFHRSGKKAVYEQTYKKAKDYAKRMRKSTVFKSTVKFMVFLNIVLVFCLGTQKLDHLYVRRVGYFFIAFNIFETYFRMFAEGAVSFFLNDHHSNPYLKSANQFDVMITLLTIAALLYHTTSGSYSEAGSDIAANTQDLMFAIPCLRILTVLRRNMNILFGLFHLLQGFYPLVALLLMSIYVFSCFGVFFFSGLLDFMPETLYDIPEANFNSLSEAISTLFQMMLGESWDSVMNACMDTEYGYPASFFFILYTLLVGVLFSNMFIGLFCDAYLNLRKGLEKSGGFKYAGSDQAPQIGKKLTSMRKATGMKDIFGVEMEKSCEQHRQTAIMREFDEGHRNSIFQQSTKERKNLLLQQKQCLKQELEKQLREIEKDLEEIRKIRTESTALVLEEDIDDNVSEAKVSFQEKKNPIL